jgi:hypothetical protein
VIQSNRSHTSVTNDNVLEKIVVGHGFVRVCLKYCDKEAQQRVIYQKHQRANNHNETEFTESEMT